MAAPSVRSISSQEEFRSIQFPLLKEIQALPKLELGFARVILMRHGESVQNATSAIIRIPFRKDHGIYPLTQKGISQVTESAVILLNTLQDPLKIIYYSPLLRAKESHQQVADIWKVKRPGDQFKTYETEPLVETDYGGIEGISGPDYKFSEDRMKADLANCKTFQEAVRYKMYRKNSEGEFQEQKMETGEEVIARTEAFIRDQGNLYPGSTVLGVTSNGLLKYMALQAYHNQKNAFLRYNQIEVGNGAMIVADTDGKQIKLIAVHNIDWSSK